MTDTKNHISDTGAGSLEGRTFRPASRSEIAEAVELAFDYRGDITLELKSGDVIVGYLFNRQADGPDPTIEVFLCDDPAPRRISYESIAMIAFTGEDTANGKSWESWIAKKESERKTETARVAAEAEARGYL